jgi:hypothetical protein
MQARKALLRKLATVADWDAAARALFAGESWLETRNTIYRFRDGVCFEVASRDPGKAARAQALIGMRLVGWVAGKGSVFTNDWETGACALLWRAGCDAGAGRERREEAMAMTSRTTLFKRGRSSLHLQALHDHVPPVDSQTFRRERGETARPRLPSSSYRSG